MITTEVDRVTEKMFKNDYTQTAEEVLMNKFTTGSVAAFNDLKELLYSYIDNSITEMFLKNTLSDNLMKHIEQWSHAPEFIDALHKRSLIR